MLERYERPPAPGALGVLVAGGHLDLNLALACSPIRLFGWDEDAVKSGHEGLGGCLEVDGQSGDFGGGPAAVG